MGNFSLDVSKWAKKATKNVDAVVESVVKGAVDGVISRSPVGNRELWAINDNRLLQKETYQVFREDSGKARVSKRTLDRKFGGLLPKGYVGGRFRANWQLGVNSSPTGELFSPSPPARNFPSAGETSERCTNAIPQKAGGNIYFLVNNLPYAQALEDGHSTQSPPGGMVALTILEFQQYIDAAVARLPK